MSKQRHWIVVPAAGIGNRFGSGIAKQYHPLHGKRIIVHTIERLLRVVEADIVVAIHPRDAIWETLDLSRHPRIKTVEGGDERADSVLNCLEFLDRKASADDWVLVHDVVRPCVAIEDIEKMLRKLEDHPVGGILAVPVSDTVKRVDCRTNEIIGTEDRAQLWVAQTPQIFRHRLLYDALQKVCIRGLTVTDEAAAVEQLGHRPLVVEGSRHNIKITRLEDLRIAEAILESQQSEELGV